LFKKFKKQPEKLSRIKIPLAPLKKGERPPFIKEGWGGF